MKRALLLISILSLATACATAHAKTPVERPPLDVPPVPPRVIEPATPVEPPPEPVGDLPATPANPRPRPQRETREVPKPETKPPDTTPVETPPATTTPPPQPAVAPLRTPTSADGAEAARRVREVIDRATKTLNTVDYRALNTEQRTQYNNAKLFIKQAEEAAKAANFEFATGLAEKAEKLAKELQGR
jgi:hypothetical protein